MSSSAPGFLSSSGFRSTPVFLFPAVLTLALLSGLVWTSTAAAAIDPMAPAEPFARYDALPEKAPPAGRLIPPPVRSTGAPDGPTAGTSAAYRGGFVIPKSPRIDDVTCVKQCVSTRKATPGAVVRIAGGYLNGVKRIVFRGKTKRIRAVWRARRSAALRVVVPRGAVNGRVFVVDSFGERSNNSPKALSVLPASRIPKEVFPVKGAISFGSSGSRFGAGRSGHSHQGQDLSARCGTPLVSARKGRVVYNQYDSGAGYYVVIKNAGTNTRFVYMHMRRRSPRKVGSRVNAGTRIGQVGTTGSSSGCHLHFEYWVGPWQTGGRPLDPLPYLKSLRREQVKKRKRALDRKRTLNRKRTLRRR